MNILKLSFSLSLRNRASEQFYSALSERGLFWYSHNCKIPGRFKSQLITTNRYTNLVKA
jgi:hypothetical protein